MTAEDVLYGIKLFVCLSSNTRATLLAYRWVEQVGLKMKGIFCARTKHNPERDTMDNYCRGCLPDAAGALEMV